MPGTVPPVADEREGLLTFLDQQRYVLRLATYGLDEEQARATPTPSALSVGGLVKHVAHTEQTWSDLIVQRTRDTTPDDYQQRFRLGPDETLTGALDFYTDVADETSRIVARVGLDDPVPVPRDVPWFPEDVEAWSVRWVLLHLIEETARHAGHADIVREAIDGATADPLMAAAEGWPVAPWITPWKPSTAGTG